VTIDAGPDELFTTPARASDAEALAALINGAYRGDADRGWTHEAHLVEGARTDAARVRALIAAPGSVFLVLRAEAGPSACVLLERRPGGVCYVGLLSVRPALQGSGIGRELLAAAERYARAHFEADCIELTVLDRREELLAWYERRGYVPTGETRPFPDAAMTPGRPLQSDLRLVVMRRTLAA